MLDKRRCHREGRPSLFPGISPGSCQTKVPSNRRNKKHLKKTVITSRRRSLLPTFAVHNPTGKNDCPPTRPKGDPIHERKDALDQRTVLCRGVVVDIRTRTPLCHTRPESRGIGQLGRILSVCHIGRFDGHRVAGATGAFPHRRAAASSSCSICWCKVKGWLPYPRGRQVSTSSCWL